MGNSKYLCFFLLIMRNKLILDWEKWWHFYKLVWSLTEDIILPGQINSSAASHKINKLLLLNWFAIILKQSTSVVRHLPTESKTSFWRSVTYPCIERNIWTAKSCVLWIKMHHSTVTPCHVSWNLSAPMYVSELKNDHLLLCRSPGLFYFCVPLQ